MNNIENEIWKDITNYEGLYQASNTGKIKSLPRKEITKNPHNPDKTMIRTRNEKILKQSLDKDGYLKTALCKDSHAITYFIHRLIALTFLKNDENLPQINHKNGIKIQNNVENLEWCNQNHNMQHAFNTKLVDVRKLQGENHWSHILNDNDILEIRKLYSMGNMNQREIGNKYGIDQSHVSYIVNRKLWGHIQ